MSKWKDLYKDKLAQKTTPEFDKNFMSMMREQMEKDTVKTPLFDWRQFLAPSLGFALVLFIFISSTQQSFQTPEVYSVILEKEELLENLNAFSEIENVDQLTDEEWEILLEGEEDV